MYKFFFLFIILIGVLDFRIGGLAYWDEALLFLALLRYLTKSKKLALKRSQLGAWVSLVLLVAVGLLSNFLHPDLQDNSVAIVKDVIAAVKFPALVMLLQAYRGTDKQRKIIRDAAKMSRWVLYIMLAAAVVGYFVNIGVYENEVRIVRCFRFYFSHPTFLVSSLIMMMAVLIADGMKRNKKELLIASLLVFMCGRTKGYVMIILMLALLYINPNVIRKAFASLRGRIHVKKSYLIIGTVAICLVGYILGKNKMLEYLRWGLTAARPALYIVGIYLAQEYFPLGSGFGTFSSSLSGEYYSKVYSKYHIDTVNGLVRGDTRYIADTFPPYIYGQFGVAGAILYINILVKLVKNQLSRIVTYDRMMAFLFLWIYAIDACVAEAFLTNTSGVQMAVLLSVFIGVEKNR